MHVLVFESKENELKGAHDYRNLLKVIWTQNLHVKVKKTEKNWRKLNGTFYTFLSFAKSTFYNS